jgi:hypothetical protein
MVVLMGLPKSIFDAEYPDRWLRTRRFLPRGLRFSNQGDNPPRHFAGGTPIGCGATCPECDQRLTLLWDLDLAAPEFPEFVRNAFVPALRLPLYICWQCMAALYRLDGLEGVVCFPFGPGTEMLFSDESPFADAPQDLPRRPFGFEPIPSRIDALITLQDIVGLEELDQDARATLDGYYGQEIISGWDMPFSVFGGPLMLFQGHQDKVCPNPKCPASALEHPFGELQRDFLMKEMALIHVDAEPELEKHYFQVVYYICCVCFSIRVEYRCS